VSRQISSLLWVAVTSLCLIAPNSAHAGAKTAAARELAEYVMSKFGKEAAEVGVEKLTVRIEALVVKYGDDAVKAVRQVGPRGLRVIEEAGENSPKVIQLLTRHGDKALWIAEHPERLGLFARFGDDAAEAMLKHKGLAEPLIETLRMPAARALTAVDGPSARRLAMMAENGELAQIGRSEELLGVVSRFGNRAMDFIWKNKKPLAVTALLAAFLADPEPFLDGTKELVQSVATGVVRPMAETLAKEVGPRTNWTVLSVTIVLASCGYLAFRTWLRQRLAALRA
jgi:hypothetical protein